MWLVILCTASQSMYPPPMQSFPAWTEFSVKHQHFGCNEIFDKHTAKGADNFSFIVKRELQAKLFHSYD